MGAVEEMMSAVFVCVCMCVCVCVRERESVLQRGIVVMDVIGVSFV